MITFPCCKINLGLNVVSRRPDGYHNIETVFYPVPLCDALEIKTMDDGFPSDTDCDLKLTGDAIGGSEADNLVVRAYRLLAAGYTLPRVHAHLFKRIPSQAGLGGGSSDAAGMIRLLNERFRLNMGKAEMERHAARLGADCAFFIASETAYATGIGDQFAPAGMEKGKLSGYYIAIVKPRIAVSTADAYRAITPRQPAKCCRDIVRQPIGTWRSELTNDFEQPAFAAHPRLADIKQRLYGLGALYAQMSGSGSALFGIFGHNPGQIAGTFPDDFTFVCRL
ncbi:4-(cytidine 5'-diphospho)-2-C-methyl-D-erythritol kinase [Prevotella dentasini]|uniref:4-(cytidine 5'-diphospho)-2-C-methyl-D-erythritol kinase n=1 Tax=Prevotella dentasini TaxID=589537 RepID=UPI000469E09F|nr:4-(cytidine 5'-diphospho)-2-C-methyl-D-erythritol kinase [Prevotella dentasini]